MAINDLTVDLDLKQNLNIYTVCKQLDDLALICYVYDNCVQADLSNYNVRLVAMKSDNIPLVQEHTGITLINNVVKIDADSQLTTTSGKTLIELQFNNKNTGKRKATFNLVLNVFPSALEVNTSISTATYTLLQELENKLDQAGDYLQNIDQAIELNNELTKQNTNATSNVLNLNTQNANATKNTSDLTSQNNDATPNISNLEIQNTQAETNIEALKKLGDVTQLAQDVTNIKTEIQTARGTESNLDARLDKVDTSLSEREYNCNITNSLNITIANGTMTAIPFDTNIRDNKNMHSTTVNNTRVNILSAGNYNIIGAIGWDSNSVGIRTISIRINGTNYVGVLKLGAISDTMIMQAMAHVYLNVNDYVELTAYQTSGSSLNVTKNNSYSPILSIQKVGD